MQKKYKQFRALGDSAVDPRNSSLPLHISGNAPESNQVFAQLIPEFSPMPHTKSINFYQNKPKVKLLLQKKFFFRVLGALPPDLRLPPVNRGRALRALKTAPSLPPYRIFSGCTRGIRRAMLDRTSKLQNPAMRYSWASRITTAIYTNEVVPLSLKYKFLLPSKWRLEPQNSAQGVIILRDATVSYCFEFIQIGVKPQYL